MENHKLPSFNIEMVNKDGEKKDLLATPENTALFRHLGSLGLSMYDHAYIEADIDEEKQCARIWRHSPAYLAVEKFMVAMQYPTHDNLRDVNQHDIEAYDELMKRETSMDFVPDEWN